MQELKDKLIVALDVDTLERAERLVNTLYPTVKLFKVGSQLFTACGPAAVEMIGKKGARVFLDLKFYDIPRTVISAVASGTGLSCVLESISTISSNIEDKVKDSTQFPVFMMTVHIEGDIEMLKAAVRGAEEKAKEINILKPLIVGVTVLTSESGGENLKEIVLERAKKAKDAGLDGVVCAVQEASMIRREFGKDFVIVTPGIRPKGYKKDDQSRVATAQETIKAGADYIVIGRPIIESENPRKAAEEILGEIEESIEPKEIVFSIFAPKATKIYIAGDFNNWDTKKLSAKKDSRGIWRAKVNLKPGRYEYKFFVDGSWVNDPSNPKKEITPTGEINSLVEVR